MRLKYGLICSNISSIRMFIVLYFVWVVLQASWSLCCRLHALDGMRGGIEADLSGPAWCGFRSALRVRHVGSVGLIRHMFGQRDFDVRDEKPGDRPLGLLPPRAEGVGR